MMTGPTPLNVGSREEFASFVSSLRDSLAAGSASANDASLERFLESLAAYAVDVPGAIANLGLPVDPDAATWRLFAILIKGATVYE